MSSNYYGSIAGETAQTWPCCEHCDHDPEVLHFEPCEYCDE